MNQLVVFFLIGFVGTMHCASALPSKELTPATEEKCQRNFKDFREEQLELIESYIKKLKSNSCFSSKDIEQLDKYIKLSKQERSARQLGYVLGIPFVVAAVLNTAADLK